MSISPKILPNGGVPNGGLRAILSVYVSSKSSQFFSDYNDVTREKSDNCLIKHMRSRSSEDDDLHTMRAQWSVRS